MHAFRCSAGILVKCSKAAIATSSGDSPSSNAILVRSSKTSDGKVNSLMPSFLVLMDLILSGSLLYAEEVNYFKGRPDVA